MAGEFRIAQLAVSEAIEASIADASMSPQAMSRALLSEILQQLSSQLPTAQLASLVEYQLDNLNIDEHVVTRGC